MPASAVAQPSEEWVTSRGTALRLLAYETPEASAAVVVLHGLGASTDVLRQAGGLDPFARLAAEGLHVLALDWPGHGRSGGRRGHLSYRAAMDAVAAATGAAAERWGVPVGLLGTSLGGVLAFYAALEEERVEAAVCHNLFDLRDIRPVIQRTRQGVLLPLAGALQRVLPVAWQQRLPVPLWALVATTDLAADRGLARALRRHPQAVRWFDLDALASIFLRPEGKPDVAAMSKPVLVAVGSADRVLPETATRHVVSRLACPHELWVLPGAGQQLLLEHPQAFIPDAAAFLRKHVGH